MDLNLLTIANQGGLGDRITNSHFSTINKLENYKNFLIKISESNDFDDSEKEQHRIHSIIGVASILEHHMNDVLLTVLKSFPSKFGNKKFEIGELQEEGSLPNLFEKKATQTILDLAYGKFEKYFQRFEKYLDLNTSISIEKVKRINEIKCTRDVYIHNAGYANSLYFHKVEGCARVDREGSLLPLDREYIEGSISFIIDVLNEIFSNLPNHYKNSSYRRVFRSMWELTCLNDRVPFEMAWEVHDEENFIIRDLENEYGFSSSEVEIYRMFKDIYFGTKQTDFGYLFRKWHPKSNEYQIALSWLNCPFRL